MKTNKLSILFYIIPLLCLIGCKPQMNRGYQVTVSILPIADFVQQIAGDKLDINVLIPQGANHSSCDFSVQQLRYLNESILCFTIGHLAFEQTQLFPMLSEQTLPEVICLADGCTLLESNCSCGHSHVHDHTHAGSDNDSNLNADHDLDNHESVKKSFEGKDPHIWMSPRLALQMVHTIYEELKMKYPRYEEEFTRNYENLKERIEKLDSDIRKRLSNKQGKAFIIYHPALSYFAADYGLEQIAMEQDGKLPSPQILKEIVENAHHKKIKLILIQKQFDIENAKSIAREIGCNVKTINPLTNNWFHEMEQLIRILEENL